MSSNKVHHKKTKKGKAKKNKKIVKRIQRLQKDETTHGIFVLRRGRMIDSAVALVDDLRMVLSPHSARRLKERHSNSLKDFVNIAGPLGVTHMVCLSQSSASNRVHLRMARLPHGPTLTFRITAYSTQTDLNAVSKHPRNPGPEYTTAPLLVLNGFGDIAGPHGEMMITSFQQLFQPLNIHSLKLSHCKRVVIIDYDPATQLIEFRHYLIVVNSNQDGPSSSTSPAVASLIASKKPQSLRGLKDISELFSQQPAPSSKHDAVQLEAHQRAVKLLELGPRMQMRLHKIEDNLFGGETLHHSIFEKTPEEVSLMRQKIRAKKTLKETRRKQQEENVLKKAAAKDKLKNPASSVSFAAPADQDESTKHHHDSGGQGSLSFDEQKKYAKKHRSNKPKSFSKDHGSKKHHSKGQSSKFDKSKGRSSKKGYPSSTKGKRTVPDHSRKSHSKSSKRQRT